MKIEQLVVELSTDPFNPRLNFEVAEEYLSYNQSASAVSFYLRTVEYADAGSVYGYTSLLRMAKCFNDQQGREYSVTNCLLQALEYDPLRPEAYYFLSQYHEQAGNWQEAYTYASLGLQMAWESNDDLVDLGYYDKYCLRFQKAIAAWWIGRKDESLAGLKVLSAMDIHPTFKQAAIYNLEKLNALL